jgi:hypothetical protein
MKKYFFVILLFFISIFFSTKIAIAASGIGTDPGNCECGGNGFGGCRQNCVNRCTPTGEDPYCRLVGYVNCLGPNDCAGSGCSGGECGGGGGCVPYVDCGDKKQQPNWSSTSKVCLSKKVCQGGDNITIRLNQYGLTVPCTATYLGVTYGGLTYNQAACVPMCSATSPSINAYTGSPLTWVAGTGGTSQALYVSKNRSDVFPVTIGAAICGSGTSCIVNTTLNSSETSYPLTLEANTPSSPTFRKAQETPFGRHGFSKVA